MSTTDPKKNELQQGPFEDTTTKTIEIQPIKITITQSRKSTHVPEPDCGCGGGGGGSLLGALDPSFIAQAVKSAASAMSAAGDASPFPGVVSPDGGFPGEGNPE